MGLKEKFNGQERCPVVRACKVSSTVFAVLSLIV